MIGKCDLKQALAKEDYDARIDGLRERLGVLQREFRDRKIPVIIVFEGWRFSGISETINNLTRAFDPRGYRVHLTHKSWDPERAYMPLQRLWADTPAREQMRIFDRSWYTDAVVRNASGRKKQRVPAGDAADIVSMERLLASDGTLIIKFFLHISRKEQKKRMKKIGREQPELIRADDPLLSNLRDYATVLPMLDQMLDDTSTPFAPWTIVEATDRRFANDKVFSTIITCMEAYLSQVPPVKKATAKPAKSAARTSVPTPILDGMDLSLTLAEDEYNRQLEKCELRLHELQYAIHNNKIPVVIVFEGCDAAGKGGAIIRLDRMLNPRCSIVEPIAAPTPYEKNHHYLWRFICNLPVAGNITIFDRSWYGRVLVERVEGFCTVPEWQRAYDEINAMEDYLIRSGAVVIKFWLQIDPETQLQRFHDRESDPLKKYKITDDDWRNREKWDAYRIAIEEMLSRTSSDNAPWILVESNDKYYARIKILKTVIRALETAVTRAKKKVKKS